ncbi:hypothetical protein [Vibrio rotiferianus]|uniref:hypothetical protein n=1 Tax=Vibrio rotiferianus TaxID=190895 RepID=UPI00390BC673
MVKSLEEKLQLKQKEIDRIRTKIQSTKSTTTSNLSEVIDYYINLQDLLPNYHKVCLAVIKFASSKRDQMQRTV